jgi:hypothetical protein
MSVRMFKVLFVSVFFTRNTQSKIRLMITVLIVANIDMVIDNINKGFQSYGMRHCVSQWFPTFRGNASP